MLFLPKIESRVKSYNMVFNVFDVLGAEISTFIKYLTLYSDGVYPAAPIGS